MTSQKSNKAILSDYEPILWCNSKRVEEIKRIILNSRELLLQAGLLRATLVYWVRQQVALEAIKCGLYERKIDDEILEKWKKENKAQGKSLEDEELRQKLIIHPASIQWAKYHWEGKLEAIYLREKPLLDQASCRIIRLSNKNLAHELYYRIKSEEQSFEEASILYGQGQEKAMGGKLPLQPLAKLPKGLPNILINLSINELTPPLRLGNQFCLVQLLEIRSAKFDKQIKEVLLSKELRTWIDKTVDIIEDQLNLTDKNQLN